MRQTIEQTREKLARYLTEAEVQALEVLVGGGFAAFAEAKLEDVRELSTGRRQPTWRNQGRYDLVIAIRDVANRPQPPTGKTDNNEATEDETEPKPVADMTVPELRAEARAYPEITGEHSMVKADLQAAVHQARAKREILFRRFDQTGADTWDDTTATEPSTGQEPATGEATE